MVSLVPGRPCEGRALGARRLNTRAADPWSVRWARPTMRRPRSPARVLGGGPPDRPSRVREEADRSAGERVEFAQSAGQCGCKRFEFVRLGRVEARFFGGLRF